MIYEYQCQSCNNATERVCRISERNEYFACLECGKEMIRVPSFGGGLKTHHPAWLDNQVRDMIQAPGDRPITTRAEHDAHCKRHDLVHL